jgi:CP family cyanate transporter-like MFS transporter
LELISLDLHLSSTSSGIFALLPIFVLGIAAPLAPWLNRRFSARSLVIWTPLVALLGILWRSYGASVGLYGGMILIGLGLGIAGTTVPGWIKSLMPNHATIMMGAYSALVGLGTAVAAAVSVPLVNLLGNWSTSLSFWAIPLLLAFVLSLFSPSSPPPSLSDSSSPSPSTRSLWKNARAWQISLFYMCRVAAAYFFFTWLSVMLQHRGLNDKDAGYLLALTTVAQIPTTMLTPWLAKLLGGNSRLIILSFTASSLSIWGIMYLNASLMIPFSLIIGMGTGAIFSRGMALMVERSRNSAQAIELSGMAQGIGFTLGAALALLGSTLIHPDSSFWPFCLIYTFFAFAGIILGIYSEKPGHV